MIVYWGRMKVLAALVIGMGVMLSGCSTVRSPTRFASDWLGEPIERYMLVIDRNHLRDPKNEQSRENVMRTKYMTSNGNTVYVVRPVYFKGCNLHWEVDPSGIIVNYRYEEIVKGECDW